MTPRRRDPRSAPDASPFSAARWKGLARAVGIAPDAPVLVALSGGADSVYLLHVLARAVPRPRLLAVHVDHGLRGPESDDDAQFCREACAELDVDFERVKLDLDASASGLEARAREARYAALCSAARARGIAIIATGHHADDALETLLQRWVRGTPMEGIAGLKPSVAVKRGMRASSRARANEPVAEVMHDEGVHEPHGSHGAAHKPLVIVRPLLALRSQEIRRTLEDHGIAWREDSSNQSARFTRNRVRNDLLPHLAELGGPETVENLRAFGAAVEELEERCAALTASLSWSPPVHAAARRGAHDADLGGTIARAQLMPLARPLQRRALWRLITEGAGAAPSRAVLEHIVDDLANGRCSIHALNKGWTLRLRSDVLLLEPAAAGTASVARPIETGSRQHDLFAPSPKPCDARAADPRGPSSAPLPVPGSIAIDDGRTITAEVIEIGGSADVLRSPSCCELDLDALEPELHKATLEVRFPRPGDRFHGLGAPGSKPLSRFLADVGVPREGRARVPLVVCGKQVLWVAGIRPCEPARVSSRTRRRLVLRLVHPHAAPERTRAQPSAGALPFES